MRLFRGTLFFIIFSIITIVMGVGLFFVHWVPKRKFAYFVRFWCWCAHISAWIVLGIRYKVIGKENIPPEPYIVAASHQSLWETMAFFLIFKDMSILFKKELLKIPFIGWHLQKMGNIPVERGTRSGLRIAEIKGVSVLDEGRPLLIFPEGTRIKFHDKKPLKSGIFFIYKRRPVPVVPVVHNSGLYFEGFWRNRSGVITILINPAIAPYLSKEGLLTNIQESFSLGKKILTEGLTEK